MRGFLGDEEGLISCIATNNYIKGVYVDGVSIPDALYEFGRTSIVHEGELDPRLHFNEQGRIAIGQSRWDLPVQYIVGLTVAVVVAPENAAERLSVESTIELCGETYLVDDLWGKRDQVRQFISKKFGDPQLFDR